MLLASLNESEVRRIMAIQDSESFAPLLDSIGKEYSGRSSADIASIKDEEYRNHVLFLCHAQTYLLLKYGIKFTDVGLIRRAIDRCTPCIWPHSRKLKVDYRCILIQNNLRN